MLTALRVLLYVQVLLGVARLAGWLAGSRLWDLHGSLGLLVALLAIAALRPVPSHPRPQARAAARFVPLLPLLSGLAAASAGHLPALRAIHVLLGLVAVGLVEAEAGRMRRWQQASGAG